MTKTPVLIARSPPQPAYRHALIGAEGEEAQSLIDAVAALGKAGHRIVTVLTAFDAARSA